MQFTLRLIGSFIFSVAALVATAQDFRIETKVYEGDAEEPVSSKVTLFHSALVYDFLSDPAEVRVFKSASADGSGHFIFLDPERKMRSEIATQEIARFMVGVKTWASQQDDPLLRFAAEPKFDETFDGDRSGKRGVLTLSSDVLTYRLKSVPAKDADRLRAYHQFSDWSAQLNVMLSVGSTPPFPRLVAGQAMARRGIVPEEVTITIAKHKPERPEAVVMHARHEIRWRLSQQDHAKIDQVDAQLVRFRSVAYDQYRKQESGNRSQ